MVPRSERFELRLDEETLSQIDVWRSEQTDLPTRSEAVRKLIASGLGRREQMQLFELARFSLLCAAKAKPLARDVNEAYAYAWSVGVYPLFDEHMRLHIPYADQFAISPDMVDELSKYLDEQDQASAVPSFYKLEDYYGVRRGRGPWGRMELIFACRYMFLKEMWNDKFWGAILKGSDHPTEAKSIVRKFDRMSDL